jgi:hypothetical protein
MHIFIHIYIYEHIDPNDLLSNLVRASSYVSRHMADPSAMKCLKLLAKPQQLITTLRLTLEAKDKQMDKIPFPDHDDDSDGDHSDSLSSSSNSQNDLDSDLYRDGLGRNRSFIQAVQRGT